MPCDVCEPVDAGPDRGRFDGAIGLAVQGYSKTVRSAMAVQGYSKPLSR